MARPILLELPRQDPWEAPRERLKSAPHEHAEALLNVYQILQELQDRGVLDLAKGMLGSSEQVLQILVNMANTPEMIRGVRNMMILAKVANSFEPQILEALEQGVQEGLAEARKRNPIGFWQLGEKGIKPGEPSCSNHNSEHSASDWEEFGEVTSALPVAGSSLIGWYRGAEYRYLS